MIYAVVALGVICVLLIVLVAGLLVFMRDRFTAHDLAVQTMADRIQAPERLPVRNNDREFVIPEREVDEYDKVGEIQISDSYGLEEEPVNG